MNRRNFFQLVTASAAVLMANRAIPQFLQQPQLIRAGEEGMQFGLYGQDGTELTVKGYKRKKPEVQVNHIDPHARGSATWLAEDTLIAKGLMVFIDGELKYRAPFEPFNPFAVPTFVTPGNTLTAEMMIT